MPGTVIVACKLERGLKIRDGGLEDVPVPNPRGDIVSERRWRPNGTEIFIRGTNKGVKSDDPASPNSDGYALTFGVDADIMGRWLDAYKDSVMVKNKLIIVSSKREEVKAQTRENAKRRTGMEPLAQDHDPRTPRLTTRELDEDGRPRQLNREREPVTA